MLGSRDSCLGLRYSEKVDITLGTRNNRCDREAWKQGLREGGGTGKSHQLLSVLSLDHHRYPPY